MQSKKPIVLILLMAFVIRLLFVLYSPGEPHEDFASYYSHAVRLVQGLGFSGAAGPTAFRTPAYPHLLALFFSLFGSSLIVAKLVNVLLGTLTVLGTYLLSRVVFSEQIALIATAVIALTPSLILYTPVLASENLATPFLLLSIWLFLTGFEKKQSWWFLPGGLCLAVVCLTRPGFLLLPGFLFLYLLWRRIRPLLAIRYMVFFGIGLAVGLLPWTIRNTLIFKEFIPVSTNGGFNLAIGLNEQATGTYIWNVTEITLGKEFDWDTYRLKDSNLTEPEMDEQLREAAREFVFKEPVRAILLVFPKLRHFYQDDVSGVYHNIAVPSRPTPEWLWTAFRWLAQIYYMLMMGAALLAVIMFRKLNEYPHALLIGFVILYWTAVHMIFFGADRFHLPILPFIFSLGSFAGWVVFMRWGRYDLL